MKNLLNLSANSVRVCLPAFAFAAAACAFAVSGVLAQPDIQSVNEPASGQPAANNSRLEAFVANPQYCKQIFSKESLSRKDETNLGVSMELVLSSMPDKDLTKFLAQITTACMKKLSGKEKADAYWSYSR